MIEAYLGKAMVRYGYQLSQERPSILQMLKHWQRHGQKRKQIGVLLRLYWPFRLPARLNKA
jgi:hypothetical protein